MFVGSHPVTRHNLQFTRSLKSTGLVGALQSEEGRLAYLEGVTNYWPFEPGQGLRSGFISMFASSITSGYRLEYNCELFRRCDQQARTYPSRLSALFAFGDEVSLHRASDLYGWDLRTVKRFRLVDGELNRVVRVNMEVISMMRHAEAISSMSPEDNQAIWSHYWSGGGEISIELPASDQNGRHAQTSGVIWEYLIEGRLELLDSEHA